MGVVYCLLYVSDMAFSANDKGNSDECLFLLWDVVASVCYSLL